MLNAPIDPTAAARVGPRQPQARDARPPQTGFSSLVDDNAAAKTEPARTRLARDADSAQRAAAQDARRDRESDDRAAASTDHASRSDDTSAPEQKGAGKTDAVPENQAKTADKVSNQPTADVPVPSVIDAAVLNAAVAAPDASAPVVPASPVPVALIVPVVAPPSPVPAIAPVTPAPLAIAAAGIAAGKAAGTKLPDAAAADAPDPSADRVLNATGDAVPTPKIVSAAKANAAEPGEIAAVKVETGFAKPAELKTPDGPAAPAAADTPAPGAVKETPKPETPGSAAKPTATATTEDAAPAPTSAPAQPHEHRAAANAAAPTIDTPSNGPQPAASHVPIHIAAAVSPTAQLTATVATAAPVPLNGLAVELASRAQSGASRFDIRLDPAELGRIDVRIDIDRNGQVTSHLTVEKPETLAMLRQDSPQLQRALNDAGLKTADGALQFTLGDQSQPRQNADGGERQTQRFIIRDDEAVVPPPPVRGYGRMLAARSGVDISV